MSIYAGKFLRINLSDARANIENIPEQVKRDFIGGRGFGIRYLYDEVPAGIDALSPENKLLVINGPLAGSRATSSSRWLAYTKSPLTGTVMKSVSGGLFGTKMKWAGFDFIIIEGKAEKPVYVYIDENDCQFLDAGELWGKTTTETQKTMEGFHGKNVGTACIGPAGENLVLYSCIASGRRTASRGGVGAVMGSKNLKAMVVNASSKKGDYDHTAFDKLVKEQIQGYHAEERKLVFKSFSKYGTGSAELPNKMGFFPVRNFRYGVLNGYEGLDQTHFDDMTNKHDGCYNCILRCGKIRTVPNGSYKGATNEGPEYESIWAFSGSLDNKDIGSLVAADKLCDDLGLDTISTGVSIGFAFELFEKGLISKEDTDGHELTWGNHFVILPLIKKIAERDGFGAFLAKGTKRMAEQIGQGSIDYAMHAKGMELPAYDPRALKAMGFSLATSNIGGSQNYGYAFQEVFGVPIPRRIDPFVEEGKADIVKFNQVWSAVYDSSIACIFPTVMGLYRHDVLAKLLAEGTGINDFGDPAQLMKIGERICNLERAYNVRGGFGRKDDVLPKRLLTEPLLKGPADGQRINDLDAFLDAFYEECGWNKTNGVPTVEKLQELGLEDVVRDIRDLNHT